MNLYINSLIILFIFLKINSASSYRPIIGFKNAKFMLYSENTDVKSIGQNKILFVETGFGCDQHGQNSTKAAVRACR